MPSLELPHSSSYLALKLRSVLDEEAQGVSFRIWSGRPSQKGGIPSSFRTFHDGANIGKLHGGILARQGSPKKSPSASYAGTRLSMGVVRFVTSCLCQFCRLLSAYVCLLLWVKAPLHPFLRKKLLEKRSLRYGSETAKT